jgi:hypothetical protein
MAAKRINAGDWLLRRVPAVAMRSRALRASASQQVEDLLLGSRLAGDVVGDVAAVRVRGLERRDEQADRSLVGVSAPVGRNERDNARAPAAVVLVELDDHAIKVGRVPFFAHGSSYNAGAAS